jgi:hypothetical protein
MLLVFVDRCFKIENLVTELYLEAIDSRGGTLIIILSVSIQHKLERCYANHLISNYMLGHFLLYGR